MDKEILAKENIYVLLEVIRVLRNLGQPPGLDATCPVLCPKTGLCMSCCEGH